MISKMSECNDEELARDWQRLQISDHFYYMCTKWFSDGDVHKYFNHYTSPYDAFINYMNVLSDFIDRVNKACPLGLQDNMNKDELEAIIKQYQKALKKVKAKEKSE
mgnify:CR=1 FL=1